MVVAQTAPVRRLRADSVFFTTMALGMLAVVFIGFAPTWFLRPAFQATAPLTTLRIVHGSVFTAWIVLLVAQTNLVAVNRRDIHRALGYAAIGLIAAMAVLGVMMATAMIDEHLRSGKALWASVPTAFALPVGDLIGFAGLAGAGIAMRNSSAWHKRLMLLCNLSLIDAGTGRFPVVGMLADNWAFLGSSFLLCDLFFIPAFVYDWHRLGRIHPATLWAAGIILADQILRWPLVQLGPVKGLIWWIVK